jgi:hypothetical protein
MTITAEDVAEAVRGWAASFGTRERNHCLGMEEVNSFGFGNRFVGRFYSSRRN